MMIIKDIENMKIMKENILIQIEVRTIKIIIDKIQKEDNQEIIIIIEKIQNNIAQDLDIIKIIKKTKSILKNIKTITVVKVHYIAIHLKIREILVLTVLSNIEIKTDTLKNRLKEKDINKETDKDKEMSLPPI